MIIYHRCAVAWLRARGWRTVWIGFARAFGDAEATSNAGVNYRVRTVYLNRDALEPGSDRALAILMHECGHVPALVRGGAHDPARSEIEAYLYGWAVILRLAIPIDRGQWRALHARTEGFPCDAW